jgi:hypothetical protein
VGVQKTPYMFPIVDGRKVEQQGNMKALDITLAPEQIRALEDVFPFDQEFPNPMIVSGNVYLEITVCLILSTRATVLKTCGW